MRLFKNWMRRLLVGSKLWSLEKRARSTRCGSAPTGRDSDRQESLAYSCVKKHVTRSPRHQFKVLGIS